MITVTIEGLDEVRSAWKGAVEHIAEAARASVVDGPRAGIEEAKSHHRYQDRTGKMSDGFEAVVTRSTDKGATGAIINRVKYASYLRDGTRAHAIEPKRRGRLAWENPGAQGDWHFAKVVQHPGTQGDDFMDRAYVVCEATMMQRIEAGIAEAKRIMEG